MFLKNIFKKSNNSKKEPVPTIFQEEDIVESSFILFDQGIQTRYKQFSSLPHNQELQIPLNLLHPTQTVLLNQPSLIEGRNVIIQQFIPTRIVLTDRQIVVTPDILECFEIGSNNHLTVSLGMIQSCELQNNKKQSSKCIITLKDARSFILTSKIGDIITKIDQILKKFAFVPGINKLYAFKFGRNAIHYELDGWLIYDIKKQFKRQGVSIKQLSVNSNHLEHPSEPYKYLDNRNGQISMTYPPIIVVPSLISYQDIIKCSKFRTKQRLPCLTYAYEYTKGHYSTLFRCSQNKVGVLQSRCKEDQYMMECIGDPFNNQKSISVNCKIYDARGYYAALGNMLSGKGYEKEEFYKNCQIKWLDIPNIHAVRDSYNATKSSSYNVQQFLQAIANSCWYDYLFLILQGSKSIALSLLNGTNVVVHCSDGWDRTAQLCSLAQLLIDPYYRTIQGFAVLVQKDWRMFGHKFRERTGQYHPTDYHPYEKSPIFIQFLDCVYQIMEQYPLSFQFNNKFLLFLADAVNECTYGTFLTNSYQQSKQAKIQYSTISVWTVVYQHKQIYKNAFYEESISNGLLDISSETKHAKIWKGHFVNKEIEWDFEQMIMRQQRQVNRALKEQYYSHQETINKLQQQLKKIQKTKVLIGLQEKIENIN